MRVRRGEGDAHALGMPSHHTVCALLRFVLLRFLLSYSLSVLLCLSRRLGSLRSLPLPRRSVGPRWRKCRWGDPSVGDISDARMPIHSKRNEQERSSRERNAKEEKEDQNDTRGEKGGETRSAHLELSHFKASEQQRQLEDEGRQRSKHRVKKTHLRPVKNRENGHTKDDRVHPCASEVVCKEGAEVLPPQQRIDGTQETSFTNEDKRTAGLQGYEGMRNLPTARRIKKERA